MDYRDRIYELINDFKLTQNETAQMIFCEYGKFVSVDAIRYHAKRKFQRKRKRAKKKDKKYALVLCDVHSPFELDEVVEIVKKHRNEIHTIIFGGDFMDCEAISVFPKEVRKPFVNEIIDARNLLYRIDKLTPDVKKVLIPGNHEARLKSYFAKQNNELSSLQSDNVLEIMVNGFIHYDRDKNRRKKYSPLSENFKVVDTWFYQFHDTIIAHPKNFSKIQLRMAVNTCNHFLARGFDFSSLFIGHTHKWGVTVHMGRVVGETGCLCREMAYADQGNVNYTPQEYGYVLLYHKDGVFDYNKSKFYRFTPKVVRLNEQATAPERS